MVQFSAVFSLHDQLQGPIDRTDISERGLGYKGRDRRKRYILHRDVNSVKIRFFRNIYIYACIFILHNHSSLLKKHRLLKFTCIRDRYIHITQNQVVDDHSHGTDLDSPN